MSVELRHGNVHKSLTGTRRLLRGSPVAVGACELVSINGEVRELARERGYSPFYGGQGHHDSRWGDTGVLLRETNTTFHGNMGLLLSEAVEPEKVAGLPRFSSTVLFDSEEGLLALTELHLHWIGPANENADTARVQQTHRGMVKLRRLLTAIEAMGYANVVLGDLNIPKEAASPGWLTPWEVFEQLGYQDLSRWHLDGGGISFALRVEEVETISKEELDSDHPGISVRVSRR